MKSVSYHGLLNGIKPLRANMCGNNKEKSQKHLINDFCFVLSMIVLMLFNNVYFYFQFQIKSPMGD